MKNVYALLLALVGLTCVVFNRFAVEESRKFIWNFVGPGPPDWLARMIVILAGSFFVLFGVLTMMGYLQ